MTALQLRNKEARAEPITSEHFVIDTITGPTERHEVFISIKHENYNFLEKKKSQIINRGEILHLRTDNNKNVRDCWLSSDVIG